MLRRRNQKTHAIEKRILEREIVKVNDYECSEVTATAIIYTLRTDLLKNSSQTEHPGNSMMHIQF